MDLLKIHLVEYINSTKKHIPPFNGSEIVVRNEQISDPLFDIQDKKPTIKQPAGAGSATYDNPNGRQLLFIDYEDFIDQLPDENKKYIKKCDFIAYTTDTRSIFILNELSQSGSPSSKFSKAREQLRESLFYLSDTPAIKSFIDMYPKKLCVFSNKREVIESPDGMAAAFEVIKEYLPDPIIHDYQPITKKGFIFVETAIVSVE